MAALILLSAVCFVSCEEEKTVTGISSIEIKDGEVTLKATLDETYASEHSKDNLYILTLSEMQASGSLKNASIVAEAKVKKNMTFKFSLTDDMGASRVASAFVLAEKHGEKYSALTEFAYITNPESVADKAEGPAFTHGIKGLASNDPMGSAAIGAEHIVLNADMGKLILDDFAPEAVRFNYENITYFYNNEEIELLDKAIDEAEMLGMRVYLRTILTVEESEIGGYLPELDNADGARYVRAFYAFLASRYSVSDYIIGDRVNNYPEFCNAGSLEAEGFERMYSFWARMSNNILKSINSEAKIYIPVDNSWKSESKNGIIGAQAFLSHFASSAKAGGDYDYAVALNLGRGEDLTALLGSESYNYSKMGAANISEFSEFIDKSEMRFKSEKRDMIVDGLAMQPDAGSKNRAAYYTMAYYTAAEHGFDAFIYSGDIYGENFTRSDLYYAFMMCGSSTNAQLKEYTDKLTGAYVPEFDSFVTGNLKYAQSGETQIKDSVLKQKKSFPAALASFEVIGDVQNFQGKLEDGGFAWLIEADLTSKASGIIATSVPAESIVGAAQLGVTVNAGSGDTLYVLLRNESANADRYTYLGECKTKSGQTTYYFDLTDFTGGVESSDTVTVAFCLVPDGGEEASVEIVDVSLYGNSVKNTETIIVIIVVIVVLLALAGLIVFLVIKRKKKAASSQED